jgi:hypothetical protein
MSSEAALFFLLESNYTADTFAELARSQKLAMSFDEFPHRLAETLRSSTNPDSGIRLFFTGGSDPTLRVRQRLKFKCVDIFSLTFARASQASVRGSSQARYDALKADVDAARIDLANVKALLAAKRRNAPGRPERK